MPETHDGVEGKKVEEPEVLQPGVVIRPIMTTDVAVQLVQKLYGLHVIKITEINSYDDKNYRIKVSETYENPHIEALWPHGYIFKVLNSMDSKKSHVDAEHETQYLLHKNGIQCPLPVLNVHGKDKHLEKIYHTSEDGTQAETYGVHIVRLLTYIPGRIINEVSSTPKLLHQVGYTAACIDRILMGWSHPALTSHKTVWGLDAVPEARKFMHGVQEESRRAQVEEIMSTFEQTVLPKAHLFKTGVIHGDMNEQNLLVRESENGEKDTYELSGVLDFGDMQDSCYVYELALVIMYMMIDKHDLDPLDVGGHVLAGYLQKMSLTDDEWDVLKVCVAGRFVQSLVYGAYTNWQDPSNVYVLVTAKKGWPLMKLLWETPKEELYARWRRIMKEYETE